jgi:2-oxoisovalerate dehydrogenase E1 component
MQFNSRQISQETLLELYKNITFPRLIEEKMLILLRQGKISKWFSGIGQEAIAVGVASAMNNDEYILPMHRNLGVFTTRQVPIERLFEQFQGKYGGYTKGRDRSFHFGANENRIVGMISHLGAQLGVADGVALATKLKDQKKATVVFSGDGASSEGDFHEAINVAAVWDLPLIFVIENNGYGLSTPNHEQYRFKTFTDKGIGYGIKTVQIDGNNVLDVYRTISKLSEEIRNEPKPVLVEAITFRMRGHEEASGTKYVPKELLDQWAEKDPVDQYEAYLLRKGLLNSKKVQEIREQHRNRINQAVDIAFGKPEIHADTDKEIMDVYAAHDFVKVNPKSKKNSEKRLVDAISDGLKQSMEKYPGLVLMGQDIAEYGGAFKVTEGFIKKFGKERVRNTPLCESAILGAALGLSIMKMKSMVEMQFADFVSCGFNQIVNNLAKVHYRWGQNADVVIRMPTGGGVGAGPFHSQSNEAWFFHVPGLKIVYPSTPYDAKGLLCEAFNDPNPIMFFEHKLLYRSQKENIPDDYYTIPIGQGKIFQPGKKATIITYGSGVHKAAEIVKNNQWDVEILDLRCLLPWDKSLVSESVEKTNRVLILHEDSLTGGIGAEIAAWITEHMFEKLDAPVMRLGALDTPVPFARNLETNYMPWHKLEKKIRSLLNY